MGSLKKTSALALICGALFLGPLLAACEEQGTAQQIGEKVDESVEQTGEAMQNAADEAGEAMKDAAEDLEQKAE